jgi:hypothetical protein
MNEWIVAFIFLFYYKLLFKLLITLFSSSLQVFLPRWITTPGSFWSNHNPQSLICRCFNSPFAYIPLLLKEAWMVLVILFRSYVFEKQFINNNIMSAIAYPIEPWKIPFIMDVPFFHVTFTVLGMTQMKIIVHSLITNFPHENLDTLIFLLLRWAYKCRIMCSPYTWGLPALWWLCINKNLSQQHG